MMGYVCLVYVMQWYSVLAHLYVCLDKYLCTCVYKTAYSVHVCNISVCACARIHVVCACGCVSVCSGMCVRV